MLDRLLNQVNILEKGLDAAWLNNEVIAGNIANADTAGYKAKSVDFESVFQDALDSDSFSTSAHISRDKNTSLRMDGNSVDVDEQMTELAKNSILYEALTYSVSKELGRIKMVINEGK